MKRTNKTTLIITLLLVMSFAMFFPAKSSAEMQLQYNNEWEWAVDIGDQLVYHVVDNVGGDRYEAYEVLGNGTSASFLDTCNLSVLEYNIENGLVEAMGMEILAAVDHVSYTYWSIAYFDEGVQTGGMVMAFPVIPINSSDGTLNLTYWGEAMVGNPFPGATYPSLDLFEFNVNGNELQIFNSTLGYYVNMTYNASGVLTYADVLVELDMGGPVILNQTITLSTEGTSVLNPIDETTLGVNVGDSLIYESSFDGVFIGVESYNVTYTGVVMGDYQGTLKPYIGANASRYIYDAYYQSWHIDENKWDEEEQEWRYAFINQIIGGGDDFGNLLRMDGPSSLVHPEGFTGADLEDQLSEAYASVHGGYLDTVESDAWSVKFSNTSTGLWIRIELEPDTGILKNLSYSMGGGVLTQLLITENDLPVPVSADSVNWGVSVDEILYYTVVEGSETKYLQYIITGIAVDTVTIEDGPMEGTFDLSFVNTTESALTLSSDWELHNPNATIGAANNEGPFMMALDGPALVVPQGTTGPELEASMGIMAAMWELTTDVTNDTYYSASGADGTHLIIEVAGSGIITHLSMKVPDPEGGVGYMELEMWYSAVPDYSSCDTTAPQFIDTPEDFSADEGYSEETISWTVTDLYPTIYTIELDGTEVIPATAWISGTVISYIVPDGLLEGDYTISIFMSDEGGNTAQDTVIFTVSSETPDDTTAPQFTDTPEDFSADEGYSEETISWTATDLHPTIYSIELDGTEVVSATTWASGTVISYNVQDGLLEGDYNITIIVSDEGGNTAQDTVIFTVSSETTDDTTAPQFTDTPEDFSADEGYSEETISWTATDLHPTIYSIELDGTEVVSATTWASGTVISYNVQDGLLEGDYNITIIVSDESGNTAQDTVIFTVSSSGTTGITISGFPFANLLIFMAVGVMILRRKMHHRRI